MIPGLRNVTIRSTFFQAAGMALYESLINLGFSDNQRIENLGISPREFLAQYTDTPNAKAAMTIDLSGEPTGALYHIEAEGLCGETATKIAYEIHMPTRPAGNSTAMAAASAVRELLEGRVVERGVVAPEGCLDPERFALPLLAKLGANLYRRTSQRDSIIG
jgi:saccharopine dehydrogenase-like NADP-dependent oxidoreductase